MAEDTVLLTTLCALAPQETLDKVEFDNPITLLGHLPAIHAAIKATPEQEMLQLITAFRGDDLSPQDRISTTGLLRMASGLESSDVQTLSAVVATALDPSPDVDHAYLLLDLC